MSDKNSLAGLAAIRRLLFIKTAAGVKRASVAHAQARHELESRQLKRQMLDSRRSGVVEKVLRGGPAMKLVVCLRYTEFLKVELAAADVNAASAKEVAAKLHGDLDEERASLARAAARLRLAENLCRRAQHTRRALAETSDEDQAVEAWVQMNRVRYGI